MQLNETLLVDTGAWIALFDPGDQAHKKIVECAEFIETFQIILPWPVTYETLRTRFTRNPPWVAAFKTRISRQDVTIIDDAPYREDAYSLTVDFATQQIATSAWSICCVVYS